MNNSFINQSCIYEDQQLDERRHHSQTQVEQNRDRFCGLTDALTDFDQKSWSPEKTNSKVSGVSLIRSGTG
jgi:hypothetical protein